MCITGADISSFGLVLDVLGALLLWRYVAEINFADKEDYLKGTASLDLADPSPNEIKRYKKNVAMTRLGIGLLVAGFLLQLVGNYLP